VDSDQVGRYGNTTSTGGGYGSDPTGPHNTRFANKLDPRADSDNVGSYGNSGAARGNTGAHTGGLTGNTHGGGLTGNTHGGGLTGNTHAGYSDPNGPHDSRLANKLDPRVDSDQPGAYGDAGATRGHTGGLTGGTHTGGLTGGTHAGYSDPNGPHDSHFANKADPRIDSDRPGAYNNSGLTGNTHGGLTGNTHGGGLTGNTHGGGLTGNTHGGGLTGNTHGGGLTGNTHAGYSDPNGPHDSHLSNKADPRIDSDRPGAYNNSGLTGNTHGGTTGNNNTAGPHDSNLMNKLDPRVDSDLDGSKTFGGNATYR